MLAWTGIALAGIGVVALAAAAMWKIGVASQKPRWLPNTQVPSFPYRDVQFTSEGSLLKGWLLLPEGEEAPHPAVVVVHGWGSNRSRVLRYAEPLVREGYAVLLFDVRCHGDSEKIPAASAFMFRDDAAAAVAYIKGVPEIDPERVAVLGHSLGGFGALLAMGDGMQVRAIVTDASPVQFETMLTAELRRRRLPLFPLSTFVPTIWLLRAGIPRRAYREASLHDVLRRNAQRIPVLMLHARGDDFIPADDLLALAEQVDVRHALVDIEGHSRSDQAPAFWDEVLGFLRPLLKR
ncbi:alpha/beta hydrolase [Paenibacillus sp. 598K]|uniref:alpha/beta hydrolase n=1 Tax=Paenibacillus sp. 598K TaxID=1117987 RepID=UPI000FF93FED|nr:alpha/beta fold hydrolase [Paenibacillus sp. 598K]GBF75201.1 alpha/beta hydrolase [Paenibacillus sp. 598K]